MPHRVSLGSIWGLLCFRRLRIPSGSPLALHHHRLPGSRFPLITLASKTGAVSRGLMTLLRRILSWRIGPLDERTRTVRPLRMRQDSAYTGLWEERTELDDDGR